ncbi:hypothetical protein J8273_2527 [Carpediemonas membranifera]|uniref:Uncharacterized protein n=1 Tax=Carpediemonas membranifera TaxID=201153 RepID=A0A8J6EB40_9EUKA|nr:hypothetical protein J8273_2527 [Carpediemonas membranifera]|eukprot:KAG9396175.1 hypothetical protein J8273_2527 [Carpediemonas membranifera]
MPFSQPYMPAGPSMPQEASFGGRCNTNDDLCRLKEENRRLRQTLLSMKLQTLPAVPGGPALSDDMEAPSQIPITQPKAVPAPFDFAPHPMAAFSDLNLHGPSLPELPALSQPRQQARTENTSPISVSVTSTRSTTSESRPTSVTAEEREKLHHERWERLEAMREGIVGLNAPMTHSDLEQVTAIARDLLPASFRPNFLHIFYELSPLDKPTKGPAPTGFIMVFKSRKQFVEDMRSFLPLSPKFDTNNGTFKQRFKVHRNTAPLYKQIKARVEDMGLTIADLLVVELKTTRPTQPAKPIVDPSPRPVPTKRVPERVETTSFLLDNNGRVNTKRSDLVGTYSSAVRTTDLSYNPLAPPVNFVLPNAEEGSGRVSLQSLGYGAGAESSTRAGDGESGETILPVLQDGMPSILNF